jgi:zinc transport system substrate-binding protein
MSKKRLKYLPLVGLFIISTVFTATGWAGPEKLKVTVSILPQAYFVERIGGDRVDVKVIMPKYADHDTYEPTPKQLVALSRSDLYIKIGMPHFIFEQKYITPILREHKGIAVVNMSEGIPQLEDDPHIWISPHTVRLAALNIEKALAGRDPAHKDAFRRNLDGFLRQIEDLDNKIKKLLERKKGAAFIIFHPALGYFAEHYGLKQLVIETEGKSPSALHLRRIADEARRKNVRHILMQKGFDQRSAKAIAGQVGADLVEIDPMEKDWPKSIWQTALKVNEALGK